MGLASALAGLLVLAVLHIALSQPWLGMTLVADEASGRVRILAVDRNGPSATLPAGRSTAAIGEVAVAAFDLIEEPDTLDRYAEFERLLARQGRLRHALNAAPVAIRLEGGEPEAASVVPRATRPISSLPLTFWSQILAGSSGFLIGAWVWSLRRRDLSAGLVALAGVLLLIMIFPAAIYSTREIALDPQLFRLLSAIDHFGALGFGVAMVALFYVYPRRLVPLRALWLLPVIFGAWWALDTFWLVFAGPPFGFHLAALLLMLLFLPAAIFQYRLTKNDPAMRAALRWFVLAVGIGSGLFISLIVLPNLAASSSLIAQSHAFLLFILVFAGVAIGVARYRLFELEVWALWFLFYFSGMLLLVLLDAILIYVVALERIAAFSLSLVVVALLYLPLRDALWRKLRGARVSQGPLFQQIVDVALSPPDADQDARWVQVLRVVFDPLRIEQGPPVAAPAIVEDGMGLALPGIGGLRSVRLGYAYGGRRLFSRPDQALADELCAMLQHATQSRQAREQGMAEERTRIARDMHDNIGAKLLSALHGVRADHKDQMIREALSDLRGITNNAAGGYQTLDEMLADVRAETAERLDGAGIALSWDSGDLSGIEAPAAALNALRSIIREAVSNVIRHAGAKTVDIVLTHGGGCARLAILDDGRGIAADEIGSGNGLLNIRARTEALNGCLDIDNLRPGTRLRIGFPLPGGAA